MNGGRGMNFISFFQRYDFNFQICIDFEQLHFYQEQWTNRDYRVKIRPSSYAYMREISNCTDQAFYECLVKQVQLANFTRCPKKCLPASLSVIGFYNSGIPVCQNENEKRCAFNVTWYDVFSPSICPPKPCTLLEYNGKIDYWQEKPISGKNNFNLKIKYGAPEVVIVHEEYLITDFTGVLGSVGGTLGLFIGFSFFNIISYLIDIFHIFISNSIKVIF